MQISHPIGVVRQELLLILDILPRRDQPLADVGVETGINKSDIPVADVTVHEIQLLAAFRQGEVIGDPLLVLEEELLDDVRLVAEAQHEILVAEVRVVLHDMPKNRSVTDLHHRLRYVSRRLAQPGPEATAEQNNLHRFLPLRSSRSSASRRTRPALSRVSAASQTSSNDSPARSATSSSEWSPSA